MTSFCRLKKIILVGGCCILLVGFSGCAAPKTDQSTGKIMAAAIETVYQDYLNHLAAVRIGECPMYPSCSRYARQAFEKHGAVAGYVMALDRLLRCGRSELAVGQRILVDGRWRIYDPVPETLSQAPEAPALSEAAPE